MWLCHLSGIAPMTTAMSGIHPPVIVRWWMVTPGGGTRAGVVVVTQVDAAAGQAPSISAVMLTGGVGAIHGGGHRAEISGGGDGGGRWWRWWQRWRQRPRPPAPAGQRSTDRGHRLEGGAGELERTGSRRAGADIADMGKAKDAGIAAGLRDSAWRPAPSWSRRRTGYRWPTG